MIGGVDSAATVSFYGCLHARRAALPPNSPQTVETPKLERCVSLSPPTPHPNRPRRPQRRSRPRKVSLGAAHDRFRPALSEAPRPWECELCLTESLPPKSYLKIAMDRLRGLPIPLHTEVHKFGSTHSCVMVHCPIIYIYTCVSKARAEHIR